MFVVDMNASGAAILLPTLNSGPLHYVSFWYSLLLIHQMAVKSEELRCAEGKVCFTRVLVANQIISTWATSSLPIKQCSHQVPPDATLSHPRICDSIMISIVSVQKKLTSVQHMFCFHRHRPKVLQAKAYSSR